MIRAYITPGNQNNNVSNNDIQNLLFISPSCRYTARGGSNTARIANNTVLVEGSAPDFFAAFNSFNNFLTSLYRSFFSFLESDLNSDSALSIEGPVVEVSVPPVFDGLIAFAGGAFNAINIARTTIRVSSDLI